MSITIEQMGQGHIININLHMGLKPLWTEGLTQERLDDLVEQVKRAAADDIGRQLPAKLARYKK